MKGNKLGFNGPGKGLCAPILTLFCIVLLSSNVFSQGIPPNILNINIDEHLPGESLRFEAIIVDDGEIGKCLLYFRQPGQAEFDYVEFFTEYEFYIALIPPEFLSKGSIEYYIYAEDTQGNSRTLPEINPEMNAYRLFVQPVKTDTPAKAPVKRADIEEEVRPISTGAGNPVSIILLSPEPGSTIPVSPELVVIALYDPEDDMLTSSVKLKIDGRDVTSSANITKDLITYLPSAEFKVGSHEISISVSDNTGNISTQNYNFGVRTLKLEERVGLKYSVTTSLESKYNKYDGRPQPANRPIDQNRPRVTAKLDWGWLKTEGELFYNYHLDETARTLDDRRQTLNRYRLKFETRPLTLILGDANPRFSELTIKGTRVRGVSGQFRLGFFGLEGFKGELAHRINPYAFGDIEDVLPDTVIVGEDTTFVVSTGNPVYRRDAFGVRTTFNFTHDIKLGFNYLRFKDDISDSSGFVDDIILKGEYEYGSQDSSEFEAFLLEKQIFPGDILYEKLWDEWEDQREEIENKLGKPKDNIVASATLDMRIFRKTFISVEAALSLLIDDQYGDRNNIDEIIEDIEADTIMVSDDDKLIADVDELMQDYFDLKLNNSFQFTFNTPENGYIKPVLFVDLRTPLPLLPTDLKLTYRRIPDTYYSLGNPSLQKDIDMIKGDTRTRLLKNRVTFSLGGEFRTDNLYNAKSITTENRIFSTGVGLMFPKYPTFNVNYRNIEREGVGLTSIPLSGDTTFYSADSTFSLNNTSTITLSSGYRLQKGRYSASLNGNIMLMNYADEKNSDFDFDNNAFILSTSMGFPYPVGLDLSFGNSINNPVASNKTVYTILNSRVSYFLFNRKLTLFAGYDILNGKREGSSQPIDNKKHTTKGGFKWKIAANASLYMDFEHIMFSDEFGDDYNENRAKLKLDWRI